MLNNTKYLQGALLSAFIFFAFLSSAKLRQFHFCRTTSNRPKNPLGTNSLSKGTCERSAKLKAGDAEGSALCHQCYAVNPSCRDLQWQQDLCGMGLQQGLLHNQHAVAIEDDCESGKQPMFLKLRGWIHAPLALESNAATFILASSPSDLSSPQGIWKTPCLSPDRFSLFPRCCLPYCTATFNPILLYGAETNKALARFMFSLSDVRWMMFTEMSRVKWVNLNRFRIWMLLWQMSPFSHQSY